MEYVELHARSAFSFLEGASLPETLMARAADLQMPAMALLDRSGLYGAPRFHTAAKKLGIRAHIGAEIAVADKGKRLRPPAYLPHHVLAEPARFPLLATSRTGYQNLCRLITRYKLRAGKKAEGAALTADLEELHEGLVCLTGGDEGPLAAALARGGYETGCKEVERLVSIFGPENVYVEVQRHFDREEEWRNRAAIAIARSLNLPLLATNGVSYATAYDREVLDLFTAIRHKTTPSTPNIIYVLRRRWSSSSTTIRRRFRTRRSYRRASPSRWTIWATSFHAIRCPMARRWIRFCASVPRKVSAHVTNLKTMLRSSRER
jgi:error-prone DNA polymerase